MRLPFVSRKEYEQILARVLDLERHFVTQRDPKTGEATQTLADIPPEDRAKLRSKPKGMSMEQRRRWLEDTDGGRLVNA